MSLINIVNLTFAYEGSYDNIFENVSFQIDTDWKLGFIGRNGRGKTTFLKLLLGKYEYSGMISKNVLFDYFPFAISDYSVMTADLAGQMNPECESWQLERELYKLEVSPDVLYRPFSSLSNGEQTKIMLAVLFLRDHHFLLIDEPTNHLDAHARKVVGKYLKSKKGFILVSHDRVFLDDCVDHILSINKANIEVQKGNFSSWFRNKQLQDGFEQAENEKLHKEVTRLSQAARRTSGWSDQTEKGKFGSGVPDRGYIGHKSAKMMKRAKSIENRQKSVIEEKSKLLKNIESAVPLEIRPLNYHSKVLAAFWDFVISYDGIHHFHYESQELAGGFEICQGDRIVLRGSNGSGKSSLIKLLMGEEISYTGRFTRAANLIVSYVPQDASFLAGSLSDYVEAQGLDESLFKAILRKLDFSRVQFEKRMEEYSGGQKKKVLLARSLCERAHLYIWDEPLNYIDVFSRIQIEELILEYQPTLLFVEHDEAFTEKTATKWVACKMEN